MSELFNIWLKLQCCQRQDMKPGSISNMWVSACARRFISQRSKNFCFFRKKSGIKHDQDILETEKFYDDYAVEKGNYFWEDTEHNVTRELRICAICKYCCPYQSKALSLPVSLWATTKSAYLAYYADIGISDIPKSA